MGFIGMGNNKLICFLIHLEKTDPEIYAKLREKAYKDIEVHSSDLTYMHANISVDEAINIAKVIVKIIDFIAWFFSDKKKTREEEVADFLSKYTRMELCESVRRVETMSHKEKIEHLAKYDD